MSLPHILGEDEVLTPRARDFIDRVATRAPLAWDPEEDAAARLSVSRFFPAVDADAFFASVKILRHRFGGLRYRSLSPHILCELEFCFIPEISPGDVEPIVWMADFDDPFDSLGIWITTDGGVHYSCSGSDDRSRVRVFNSVYSLIESDALHEQSASWHRVGHGGDENCNEVRLKAESMARVVEASGSTESWWETGGVRVHLNFTGREVYRQKFHTSWSIWVDGDRGNAEALRIFGHDLLTS